MAAPFIQHKNTVRSIMLDVIVALLPISFVAYWAFGYYSLLVMGSCVAACLVSDWIFGFVFLKQKTFLPDGSGIITGLLLAFTLSPITPWYIAAFGGATAVLFGKILWGGVGKNRFNPALVGREFMSVFFPAVMSGGALWNLSSYVEHPKWDFTPFFHTKAAADSLSGLLYQPSGAVGEYSLLLILLGGLYLVWRRRISWHIPVTFLLAFWAMRGVLPEGSIGHFSMNGILVGCIYMATDMPSSPSYKDAKLYYGLMLGVVVAILLFSGVSFAYMSYGILILNGFNDKISEVLRPDAWGHATSKSKRWEYIAYLTLAILTVTMAVVSLHYAGLIHIPVYLFIGYIILKYFYQHQYKIVEPF